MPCHFGFWSSASKQLDLDRIETFFNQFLSISASFEKEVLGTGVSDGDDDVDEESRTYPYIALFGAKDLYGIEIAKSKGVFEASRIKRKKQILQLINAKTIDKQLALYARHGREYVSWKLKQYDKNRVRTYKPLIDYILKSFKLSLDTLLAAPHGSSEPSHNTMVYMTRYTKIIGNNRLLIEIMDFLEDVIKGTVDDPKKMLKHILNMVDEFDVLTEAEYKAETITAIESSIGKGGDGHRM